MLRFVRFRLGLNKVQSRFISLTQLLKPGDVFFWAGAFQTCGIGPFDGALVERFFNAQRFPD